MSTSIPPFPSALSATLTYLADNLTRTATAVDMLLNHKHLTIQDSEVVSNALEHFRKRPALGFSDCLVLEIARKAGHLPFGTFDRDLAKIDGTRRLQ